MTCLYFSGYESGSTTASSIGEASEGGQTALGTTPTITATTPRSGGFCAQAAANAQSQFRRSITRTDGRGYYHQAAFRIETSFPSATTTLFGQNTSWEIRMTTSGTLILVDGSNVQIGSASAAMSLGTWFVVEVYAQMFAAADDTIEARVDGVTFVGPVTQAVSATVGGNFDVGPKTAYGAARTILWDDVIVCDDQGGAPSNTWLGQSKVLTSLPISDSSRVGWTGANGATTNLWDSLDNRPPVGAVLTVGAPDTNQIRNAASSATDNLVVNMQSLLTAGVGASDDILGTAVRAVCSVDSATATNGSLEIIATNGHPAVAESSTDWSVPGVAGTYPTGWQTVGVSLPTSSGVTNQPTIVDRSVSPQVEIGKRTAATRALGVCQCRLDIAFRPVTAAATLRLLGTLGAGT